MELVGDGAAVDDDAFEEGLAGGAGHTGGFTQPIDPVPVALVGVRVREGDLRAGGGFDGGLGVGARGREARGVGGGARHCRGLCTVVVRLQVEWPDGDGEDSRYGISIREKSRPV